MFCANCVRGQEQCNCHFYAVAHAGPAPLRVQCAFRFLAVLVLSCHAFVLYKIVKTIGVDGFRAGSLKIMMLFSVMYLIHGLGGIFSQMLFLYFDSVLG